MKHTEVTKFQEELGAARTMLDNHKDVVYFKTIGSALYRRGLPT